jgi:site-specific recombinase XerD
MLKLMDVESYQHIRAVRQVRGSALPRGRALQREEIRELFAVCEADTGSIGVRDAALLAIILGCGLRRSEAVALSYEDIEPADRALKILGKGNKERLAYVPDGAWQRLQFWVDQVRGGTGAAVSAHPPARRGDGVPAHRPGGVPYPPGSPASGRAGKMCASRPQKNVRDGDAG